MRTPVALPESVAERELRERVAELEAQRSAELATLRTAVSLLSDASDIGGAAGRAIERAQEPVEARPQAFGVQGPVPPVARGAAC